MKLIKTRQIPGDALESPAPSPQHGSASGSALGGDDMHSRLELYATRLAQVELGAKPGDTPDRFVQHYLLPLSYLFHIISELSLRYSQ